MERRLVLGDARFPAERGRERDRILLHAGEVRDGHPTILSGAFREHGAALSPAGPERAPRRRSQAASSASSSCSTCTTSARRRFGGIPSDASAPSPTTIAPTQSAGTRPWVKVTGEP